MNQKDYDRLCDKCKDNCLCEIVRCLINDLSVGGVSKCTCSRVKYGASTF